MDRPSLEAAVARSILTLWQKREEDIARRLRGLLPRELRELIDRRAA